MMAQTLTPDAPVPDLTLPLINGATWSLQAQSPDMFTMVIVYRGLHCPMCEIFLKDLKEHYQGYVDQGFSVVIASMDSQDRARQAQKDWALDPIPMAYGLTRDQARAWGLYLSNSIREGEPDTFAEPGLFWVRPDGRLFLTDISNSPFARPDLGVMLGKVDFIRERNYPARGSKTD